MTAKRQLVLMIKLHSHRTLKTIHPIVLKRRPYGRNKVMKKLVFFKKYWACLAAAFSTATRARMQCFCVMSDTAAAATTWR